MKAGEGIRHNRSTRWLRDTMVIFVLVGTRTLRQRIVGAAVMTVTPNWWQRLPEPPPGLNQPKVKS
jgi:ABC-type branched-subunit amino acid transport system permease subunit